MHWKFKLFWLVLISLSIIFLLINIILVVVIDKANMAGIIAISTIDVISILIISIFMFLLFKQSNFLFFGASKSFYNFFSDTISQNGIGVILLSENFNIIWISEFIKERFGMKIHGKNILTLSKNFNKFLNESNSEEIIEINNILYSVFFNAEDKILILNDVTRRENATNLYEKERVVLGELAIDNFQYYQSIFTNKELFSIQNKVIQILEELESEYNFSYNQYSDDKFLLITNKNTLDLFEKNQFSFLNKIRDYLINDIKISVSIGMSKNENSMKDLIEMSKEALKQSQSRGGDQVTIFDKNKKPIYLGSKSEIAVDPSRTRVKLFANHLITKLQDPSIKKVILYGHLMADLDAVGSTYALLEVAQYFNKKAYIQNVILDQTALKMQKKYFKSEELNIFIKDSHANSITDKETLVIICDTSSESRTENPMAYEKAAFDNIFIIDHHRTTVLPDFINEQNTYIDSLASSACEIITEIISFTNLYHALSKRAFQMLLNGIYLDTNQFQKSTTFKSFAAAALLEDWGAKAQESIDLLRISEKNKQLVDEILKTLREVKPGFYLATYDQEVPGDVVSISADEILRVANRKAAFVIAKIPNSNEYKLSARGVETNVQIIAEAVGGGGHYSSAAATSKESLEIFQDNIIQAIISEQSYNNNN